MGNWLNNSIFKGLGATLKALQSFRQKPETYAAEGSVTIQYPFELPHIPVNGRYQLDVAMDDCIVCDLCAKICPVNCIQIEPIRATETFATTSDGSPRKIYAATFDIDMAKCMYCGLCTTVCPTECIIMTDTYDKSVQDIKELNYAFSEMSPEEIEEKRKAWDDFQLEKQKAKEAALKKNND
jgi:NADH-quinone oxidoreductase subunit I